MRYTSQHERQPRRRERVPASRGMDLALRQNADTPPLQRAHQRDALGDRRGLQLPHHATHRKAIPPTRQAMPANSHKLHRDRHLRILVLQRRERQRDRPVKHELDSREQLHQWCRFELEHGRPCHAPQGRQGTQAGLVASQRSRRVCPVLPHGAHVSAASASQQPDVFRRGHTHASR